MPRKSHKQVYAEREALQKACMPLLKYLCENHNPHVTAIITGTSIQLVGGICGIGEIYDFLNLKD